MPAAAQRRPLVRLWWLHPTWAFAAVLIPTILLAVWQTPAAYSLYRTPKYLNGSHVLLAVAAVAGFAVGRRLADATGRLPQPLDDDWEPQIKRWFYVTLALSLFGYVVWFGLAWKNGLSLGIIQELIGREDVISDALREQYLGTIPGVTTCVQFAVAASALGTWLLLRGVRGILLPLLALFGVTAFRSVLNSERLALIELLVPACLVALRMQVLGCRWSAAAGATWQLAPLAGVGGLLVLFGFFETFRSWTYYQNDFDSLVEFTLWRIGGYYTTAHNNGAMAWETRGLWPLPYTTLAQFWEFPLVENSPLSYYDLTGIYPMEVHETMLERYGSPELNNYGGLFGPAFDYGLAGFGLYWMLYGFVAGRLYRSYLVGSLAGLTIYPIVFVSLLEVPRLNYIHTTRVLPALVLLVWIGYAFRQSPRPAGQPRELPTEEGLPCASK